MKFLLCLSLLVLATSSQGSFVKIDAKLQKTLQVKDTVDILVSLTGTSSVLKGVKSTFTKSTPHGARTTAVANALKAHAQETQKVVLSFLKGHSGVVKSLWISNMILVEGADEKLINSLTAYPEVIKIQENGRVHIDDKVVDVTEGRQSPRAEWGVTKIRSEEAWAMSNMGENAKIGVIDTGARHTHQDLRDGYVGNDGSSYAWYDPAGNSETPNDGHGHGTHCTGTIAGKNGIGVAPEAKWVSCKGLQDNGSGSFADLIECGQWMACPTDPAGNNPDCTQAPHLVSNSWGGSPGGQTFYDDVIDSWNAAGILGVFAIGNSGFFCSSAISPGDSAAGVISVGASNPSDGITDFSSRGPSAHGEVKPDVSAPGENVRSAGHTSDTAYATMSGTSMACPHAAGLLALAKSHDNGLNIGEAWELITSSAISEGLNGSGQTCGGISDDQFPNNKFGHGRIDALNAMTQLLGRK